MAIEKIRIEQFLSLSKDHPVFDVRSPSEFSHAHIPGAYSLPLFDDGQRKIVGTIYKQQGRQQAIKIGLDYFGAKMRKTIEEVEKILSNKLQFSTVPTIRQVSSSTVNHSCVLVHCWRGGMRSAALAWLLDLYGYKVYTLGGGYKTFRNWVLQQFNNPYSFKVLGGYTGSGKTIVIKELRRLGYPAIDLENLANHKGSAFGSEGEKPQPSQEMFENLINAIIRIQKRLGGLETRNSINYILEDNIRQSFSILLKYYEKCYEKGLHARKNLANLLNKIPCSTVSISNMNALFRLQTTLK